MNTKKLLLLINFCVAAFSPLLRRGAGGEAFSQNVGINTTGATPHNSAILDVASTAKGMLIPRMTTAQMNAIASPAVGLQVYNTDCKALNYYSGSCWIAMSKALPNPHPITSSPATTDFCAGQSRTYSVPAVAGASDYSWSVPAGAIINSGQGTTSIDVTFGNISGNVCVNAHNACESSASTCLAVNINIAPLAPGNISGAITAVPGQTTPISYSIASIPGATTYNWTVPPGASIASGTGTTNIVVNYSCNTTPGYVSVTQTAACGTSTPASLAITVSPLLVSAGAAKNGPNTIGGSPTASGGTGTGSYLYSWNPSSNLSSATAANPSTWACAPAVTYTVTVTDANACTASSSVAVTPNLTASAGSAQTSTCSGVGIGGSPTAAGGTASYTYSWSPPGVNNSAISNPSAMPGATTTYTVTVYDAHSCTATSSVTVTYASCTSNTWCNKPDFGGGGRQYATGFSIGTKGYMGTGYSGSNKKDFWEFDPASGAWTQKADFGGTARQQAVGFSIGTKGYIGTGDDGAAKQDFWEWDQASNTWTQKADFTGAARSLAVGFSIGTKGYIGTGTGAATYQDFYEWDQGTNTWTSKATFTGAVRYGAVGFSIGTKGYIGTGYTGSAYKLDFYEWNQSNNSWTAKTSFTGTARRYAVGFSIGTKGYIGTGYDGSAKQDFFEWDQSGNSWTQKADFTGGTRYNAVGLSIGTKGYIGTGQGNTDFYEWCQ